MLIVAVGLLASRSEEHTSELQSRLISYAVFCLKKKKKNIKKGWRDRRRAADRRYCTVVCTTLRVLSIALLMPARAASSLSRFFSMCFFFGPWATPYPPFSPPPPPSD